MHPISISKLTTSSEIQRTGVSNDILSVRKYCQLFTHESNTKIHSKTSFKPMSEKTQNYSFPLGPWAPSNTPILDRPHSPPQTASRSNLPFCHSTTSGQTDQPTDQSCPWVGLTDGLGWVEYGSRIFVFSGSGRVVGLKWQICEKQMCTHVTVIVK